MWSLVVQGSVPLQCHQLQFQAQSIWPPQPTTTAMPTFAVPGGVPAYPTYPGYPAPGYPYYPMLFCPAPLLPPVVDAKQQQNEQSLTQADKKLSLLQVATPSTSLHGLTHQTFMQVFSMASVQCNQKCCHDLKCKLMPSAEELADRDQPLGPELFGDSLKEHYKQIQAPKLPPWLPARERNSKIDITHTLF